MYEIVHKPGAASSESRSDHSIEEISLDGQSWHFNVMGISDVFLKRLS